MNVSVPVRAPIAVGANVTLIVQVPAAARVAGATGQLLVSAKSSEPAIELTVKGRVPELVSVSGIAALVVVSIWPAQDTFVGLKVMPGTAVDPVPVRFTSNVSVLDIDGVLDEQKAAVSVMFTGN
jgi:hypothetical protein